MDDSRSAGPMTIYRSKSYSRAIGMRAQSDTVRRVEYKILHFI